MNRLQYPSHLSIWLLLHLPAQMLTLLPMSSRSAAACALSCERTCRPSWSGNWLPERHRLRCGLRKPPGSQSLPCSGAHRGGGGGHRKDEVFRKPSANTNAKRTAKKCRVPAGLPTGACEQPTELSWAMHLSAGLLMCSAHRHLGIGREAFSSREVTPQRAVTFDSRKLFQAHGGQLHLALRRQGTT